MTLPISATILGLYCGDAVVCIADIYSGQTEKSITSLITGGIFTGNLCSHTAVRRKPVYLFPTLISDYVEVLRYLNVISGHHK